MSNWGNRVFLTFDIDWAGNEVLADTLSILDEYDVSATFFVTHDTPLLDLMRKDNAIELGIHPNFNNLLFGGDTVKKSMGEITCHLKEMVPEAVSVRSHSLTQNTRLLDHFVEIGMTHEVNLLIPKNSGIEVKPFRSWNGLIRTPFVWEDDVHAFCFSNGTEKDWSVERFLDARGLKIFNFHPVHVFLNTETLKRYEICREFFNNPVRMLEQRNSDAVTGTRNFLLRLIQQGKDRGMEFGKIGEIQCP